MGCKARAAVSLICVLVCIQACFAQTTPTFEFPTAAVSADNGPCAQLGVDLLQQGGNAIDAAIGTTICLGTLQGFASGIGGGAVALYYNAESKEIVVFDFREFAPGAASQDMYKDTPNESQYGGKAVAVPGFIAGVWRMWSDYGQLGWRDILEPNIALAENSTVNSLLAETIQEEQVSILAFPGLREVFAPGGTLLVEGDILLQPALANTLRAIQEDPMSFYYGKIAEDLIQDIQDAGGIMSMNDLDQYWQNGVVIRHPVSTYYQGYKVVGAPPPYTGGLCMSLALNLIEPYNFPMMTNMSSLAQHYMIEAWKWAYSDRMAIGDPSFVDQTEVISAMLSKDHAALLRQKFSSTTTYPPSHYQDLVSPVEATIFDAGTSHMSVVDAKGNVVAMTSTVNLSFGSKVLSPLTGVILNNEMDDFSSPNQTNYFGQPPSEANYIAPFKKPISSMTPTIVLLNDEPVLAIGAAGGTKIITATMQALLGVIAWGEQIGTAIGNPRCHNQNTGDTTVEAAYPSSFVSFLKSTDHIIYTTSGTLASVQGIAISPSVLYAASDWRKYGEPAGY